MLKKIQNVWNFIIKNKKIANNTNLYSIKNNILFTNAISTSLIFYISNLKTIKIKQIKTINKIITFFSFYNFLFFLLFFIFFSLLLFILYIY